MTADVLCQVLLDRGIRLMVLNSCRGAFAGRGGVLTSTAARVATHLPAVVAMQIPISDKGAVEFATEFYDGLFRGLPIEVAVTEARLALASGSGAQGAIEWPAPVLYLSTLHDVLKLRAIKVKRRGKEKGLRSKASARPSEQPVEPKHKRDAPEDDPQKYQWGGSPTSNGYKLSGSVKPLDADWYQIDLSVRAPGHKHLLAGPVTFHLHDSFDEPVRTVTPVNGVARLRLVAYGAFTVGAEAERGKIKLELDLATIPGAPRGFRES